MHPSNQATTQAPSYSAKISTFHTSTDAQRCSEGRCYLKWVRSYRDASQHDPARSHVRSTNGFRNPVSTTEPRAQCFGCLTDVQGPPYTGKRSLLSCILGSIGTRNRCLELITVRYELQDIASSSEVRCRVILIACGGIPPSLRRCRTLRVHAHSRP